MPEPFISQEDLSDYLGQDVTEDPGALAAVDAACDIVRTISGQDFNQATSSITLDGSGTDALLLPQLPVSKAGTVAIGGTANAGVISGGSSITDYALNGDGILLRTAGAALAGEGEYVPTVWPKGRRNIAVTYEHGYADEEIPRDVRMVALSIASRLVVQGVTMSESIGPATMRYAVASTDLTSGERMILAKYRRTR